MRRFSTLGRDRPLLATLLIAAATTYLFQLGRAGFDDAEAYSAYIASRPNLHAVLEASRQLDPGKGGGLYALALHWYSAAFGIGEIALRAFSAAFAIVSVMLVYALAAELFGPETALLAAALWAFNPLLLIVARWARMYTMFIALTLGGLLAMRKLQKRPTSARIAAFGVLGAAALCTHLGAGLILGAEAANLARDRWRKRPVLAGCTGLMTALILFAPLGPDAIAQVHASALGHRFDWMGSAYQTSLAMKAIGSLVAMLMGVALVFGPPLPFDGAERGPRDNPEPMRWCAIWSMLPVIALRLGSLLLHPMFEIRYIAPVIAGFAILAAHVLGFAGAKIRNLATAAMVSAFLMATILFQLYHPPFALWRQIAREVEAANSPSHSVFFEAGYVMGTRQAAGINPDSLIKVLPNGYLRIPFDYYFAGPNPRRTLNPFRTALARETLAQAARRDGGAWLVSHLNEADLATELPANEEFVRDRRVYDTSVSVSLYYIRPRNVR